MDPAAPTESSNSLVDTELDLPDRLTAKLSTEKDAVPEDTCNPTVSIKLLLFRKSKAAKHRIEVPDNHRDASHIESPILDFNDWTPNPGYAP